MDYNADKDNLWMISYFCEHCKLNSCEKYKNRYKCHHGHDRHDGHDGHDGHKGHKGKRGKKSKNRSP